MEHANGKKVIECSPTFNPFEVTELGIMAIKPSGEGERSRKIYGISWSVEFLYVF